MHIPRLGKPLQLYDMATTFVNVKIFGFIKIVPHDYITLQL